MPSKDEIRSEQYERELEVPINAAAKQSKLERIAVCLDLVDVEKVKMSEVTSVHREEIKALQAEEKKLRKDVAKSTETRKVKCVTVKKFKTHEVQVIRCDTRAIVESRTMTAEELQEQMDYDAGSAVAKGAKKGLMALAGGKKSKKVADGPAPLDEHATPPEPETPASPPAE